MPINHQEIIEDFEANIHKYGGALGEWCVGTAKDTRRPFLQRHLAADSGDGLAYREAITTTAAQSVVAHLVNARGLELERDAVPEPGKIVFVYRQTRDSGSGVGDSGKVRAGRSAASGDPATMHEVAV